MKTQFVSRKTFEYGSHRPYAAMLYLGYAAVPSSVYNMAYYEDKHGTRHAIHAMFVSTYSAVIIYV